MVNIFYKREMDIKKVLAGSLKNSFYGNNRTNGAKDE